MTKLYKFLLLLFFCACGTGKEKSPPTQPNSEDSVYDETIVDTVLSGESFQFFTKTTFKNEGSKFVLVNSWKEEKIMESDFTIGPSFLKEYHQLLRISPDSTQIIDFGTTNVTKITDRNGKNSWEELGPDSELSLLLPKENKKQRLLFLGPGAAIEDAGWMDQETVVIAVKQLNFDESKSVTMIYKYHLPTQTFYLYEQQ
jgi:hypothetical protein